MRLLGSEPDAINVSNYSSLGGLVRLQMPTIYERLCTNCFQLFQPRRAGETHCLQGVTQQVLMFPTIPASEGW